MATPARSNRRLIVAVETVAEGIAVMRLHGNLDINSVPILEAYLEPLWRQPGLSGLVVDVAEVDFCDSTGLGKLMGARNLCEGRGLGFALAGVTGIMQRLLVLTGLYPYLEAYPDTDTAVRNLTGTPE
ncbi:STAS domain-containing protein [Planobispora rosea]|uniref:STAS domain-containing protein n=1 Tax=Planobispora rosea TaxID=35762 RepID=UPI000A06AB88|nr:STAS domain-containing protein [Planobispora rosea]